MDIQEQPNATVELTVFHADKHGIPQRRTASEFDEELAVLAGNRLADLNPNATDINVTLYHRGDEVLCEATDINTGLTLTGRFTLGNPLTDAATLH